MAAKKIVLDAGHYGNYNRSPVNAVYYESRMNWTLHLLLKAALEKYGFEVEITRQDAEKDLELTKRGKKAAGADFFISIHSNACGTESIDHPIAYGYVDDKTITIDDISRDLGALLAETVAQVMGTKQAGRIATRRSDNDRNRDGVLNDEYYGVLHGAKSTGVPGIILEHSFHTNLSATNWLLDEANLKKLAEAEAAVIANYFGQEKLSTGKKPAKTETVKAEAAEIYRVRKSWENSTSQIGAYTILDNAKAACKEGYSVYNGKGEAVYSPTAEEAKEAAGLPYTVRVDITSLWIRKGPGTDYNKVRYTGKGCFTIVEEADGKGAAKWGRLKSGAGWIALDYAYQI